MTSDQTVTHSTEHGSFRIARELAAAPPRAFAAWAEQSAKARWFGPPEKPGYSLDFRVGGSEHLAIDTPDGRYRFDAHYYDIVPDSRIIYSYEMYLADKRISVSVACVEFEATSSGTRMTLSEYGLYLEGTDTNAKREHGTGELLNALAGQLAEQAAT